VKCSKYSIRPFIEHVIQINDETIMINQMIGSYSGARKEWKGKLEGKHIIFSDKITLEDVITSVTFTKGIR